MGFAKNNVIALIISLIAWAFVLVGLASYSWYRVGDHWYGLLNRCSGANINPFLICADYGRASRTETNLLFWSNDYGQFRRLHSAGVMAFIFLVIGEFFLTWAVISHIVGAASKNTYRSGPPLVRRLLGAGMNLLALIFILLGWLWWVAIFPYPASGISSAGYSFVLPLVASFLLIFSTIVSFLAGRRTRGDRERDNRAHH